MSVAGRHKTFMAPFHTLISCDILFVLFRLDSEHDVSHRTLWRASIHFAASGYFNLDCKTWQLLRRRRHAAASPGGITTVIVRLTALTDLLLILFYSLSHF